jgi:hypothetical protein
MEDRWKKSLGDKVSKLVWDVGAHTTEARAVLDDSNFNVDRARRLLIERGQSGRRKPGKPGFSPPPDER